MNGTAHSARWTPERARRWIENRPWLCGCNFVPSTAINSTEMWQADSFDEAAIERELGWAADIGFNSVRVFLQYLVWEADPHGLKRRMDRLLSITSGHGISVMPVLFDDCCQSGRQPYLGKQDAPIPGVCLSGWTPSPGHARVVDRSVWPRLAGYVKDIVGEFGQDERVVIWDLYNEPGGGRPGGALGEDSLPLLTASFEWARAAAPSQPLTVGTFGGEPESLTRALLAESDLISFHAYMNVDRTRKMIVELEAHGRPVVCTEWMARTAESRFETHLPLFNDHRVGCYSWGLVAGKTQTYYPWRSQAGAPEPELWFSDLLREGGAPYRSEEVQAIRRMAGRRP